MIIGMLWFDRDKIEVKEKILKAIQYYIKKYGRKPDTCHLSIKDFHTFNLPADFPVQVISDKTMLNNTLWIGVNNDAR